MSHSYSRSKKYLHLIIQSIIISVCIVLDERLQYSYNLMYDIKTKLEQILFGLRFKLRIIYYFMYSFF